VPRATGTLGYVSESHWRVVFEGSPIGMAEIDAEGCLTLVNPAMGRALGHEPDSMVGRLIADFIHRDNRADVLDALSNRGALPATAQPRERPMMHADGTLRWAELHLAPLPAHDGERGHVLLSCVDVTTRHEREWEVQQLVDHDATTGLLSRIGFGAELRAHLDRVQAGDPMGCVLAIDIDHLRQINESQGDDVGDQVIASVAVALDQRLRETDPVARIGGDRFAVLLPHARGAQTKVVAGDIVQHVRNQVAIQTDGRLRQVTVSVGVAMIKSKHLTMAEMLASAEAALEESKNAGGNRWTLFQPEAIPESAEPRGPRDTASTARLFDGDRFTLLSQPILDLRTSLIDRHELLLRIRQDDGTLLAPAALLDIAGRSGRIGRIDRWVTDRAIEVLGSFGHQPELLFEVNISGRSLGDPHLMAFIETRIRNAEIDPQRLIFEISQKSAVANIDFAREFSHHLTRIGCHFAIDNFGAGGLSILKHLPFDYLKIDGEFVADCLNSRTDRLIIEAIVHVAKGLDKRTVAEGVQSGPTLDYLRELGVDYAQGFYVGEPSALDNGRR